MLRLAASLPDPLIRLLPDRLCALGLRVDQRPQPARQPLAALGVQQHRIERGAEHVVLALVKRAVPDPDRARAVVALRGPRGTSRSDPAGRRSRT